MYGGALQSSIISLLSSQIIQKDKESTLETYMFWRTMNDNIKLAILFSSRNRFSEMINLLRRIRDMNFPSVRMEDMSYLLPRLMEVEMRMVPVMSM